MWTEIIIYILYIYINDIFIYIYYLYIYLYIYNIFYIFIYIYYIYINESFGLRNTKECSMTYRQSETYSHKNASLSFL